MKVICAHRQARHLNTQQHYLKKTEGDNFKNISTEKELEKAE